MGGSLLSWAFYQEGSAARWVRADVDAVLAPYLTPKASKAPREPKRRRRQRRRNVADAEEEDASPRTGRGRVECCRACRSGTPRSSHHHAHADRRSFSRQRRTPSIGMRPRRRGLSTPGQQHEHGQGEASLCDCPLGREGTGTSWQPDATIVHPRTFALGDWQLAAHAQISAVFADEDGPRGDDQFFSTNHVMISGRRRAGAGVFGVRSMWSLEPSMGKRGYPLLLQTGETADGVTPLVDRQHPHDFPMELAATYSRPFGADRGLYLYAAAVGTPALGPPTFMHRASAVALAGLADHASLVRLVARHLRRRHLRRDRLGEGEDRSVGVPRTRTRSGALGIREARPRFVLVPAVGESDAVPVVAGQRRTVGRCGTVASGRGHGEADRVGDVQPAVDAPVRRRARRVGPQQAIAQFVPRARAASTSCPGAVAQAGLLEAHGPRRRASRARRPVRARRQG